MRIIFLLMVLFSTVFYSCKKDDNCKAKQAVELQELNGRYQQAVSNPNRNEDQIRELTARYERDKKVILEKCR